MGAVAYRLRAFVQQRRDDLVRVGRHKIDIKWFNGHNQLEWINPINNEREVLVGRVSIDHILSKKDFDNIPDVNILSAAERKSILDHPDNLQPMLQSANSSKGAKSEFGDGFREWGGRPVAAGYRSYLLDAQQVIMQRAFDAILRKREGL